MYERNKRESLEFHCFLFFSLSLELLGHFTNDIQSTLTQFEDYPGLSTPPISPPDTISNGLATSLPTQVTMLPGITDPIPDMAVPSPSTTPPTPPEAPPPCSHQPFVQTSHQDSTVNDNNNTNDSFCHKEVKNGVGVVTASNGQLVQVLKSGEVVPISALFASLQSNSSPNAQLVNQVSNELVLYTFRL